MRYGKLLLAFAFVITAMMSVSVQKAEAGPFAHRMAHKRSAWYPWHGAHYDPVYGRPVALVIPPTAGAHTDWGWGVGSTRVTRNYHQFGLRTPGSFNSNVPQFYPRPRWPSDTTQFGTYYIRGPW